MSVENSSRTWSIAVSNSTRLWYNLWLITCDRKREVQSFSMNYQKQFKTQPLHRTYFTAFWRHTRYASVKEWTRRGGKASPAPTPNPDIERTSAPPTPGPVEADCELQRRWQERHFSQLLTLVGMPALAATSKPATPALLEMTTTMCAELLGACVLAMRAWRFDPEKEKNASKLMLLKKRHVPFWMGNGQDFWINVLE